MNISFLNTSFLLALPLALIPLALHLFSRKNSARVPFSYLDHIKQAAERTRASTRLRKYLLLIIRTLIMLLLVLYFAKPVWRFGNSARDNRQSDSVIILMDLSYSMGYAENGKTRFEQCREIAGRMLKILPAKSRIGIIAYSDRVEAETTGLTNDTHYLESFLSGLKLTNRITDFSAGWNAAQRLVASLPSTECSIILLSDGAAHEFKDKGEKPIPGSKVLFFQPKGAPENIWVSSLKADYDGVSGFWQLETQAGFSFTGAKDSWPISYYQGGKKCGSDLLDLKKEPGKAVNIFTYSGDESVVSIKAQLAPDNLNADNYFYETAKREDPFKVWIIDGDPKSGGITSDSFYLKTVFPSARVLTESEMGKLKLELPGVVMLANVRSDTPEIEKFIAAGGGALFFPGDRTSDEFQPQYLPATLGSQFTDRQAIKWSAPPEHFLSKSVDIKQFELDKLFADKGFVLQAREGAAVLASFSNGWPYLVEKNYGSGKVIMCASSADRDWNNVPGRPVFPALMQFAARYLSGTSLLKENSIFYVGDTIRARAVPNPEIITPSGTSSKVKNAGDELIFENTDEPGIYKLLSYGKEYARYAVNLNTPSGESDLTAATAGTVRKLLPDSAVIPLSYSAWEKEFTAIMTGIDATRQFLAALLLLLILEILLSNPAPPSSPSPVKGAGKRSDL